MKISGWVIFCHMSARRNVPGPVGALRSRRRARLRPMCSFQMCKGQRRRREAGDFPLESVIYKGSWASSRRTSSPCLGDTAVTSTLMSSRGRPLSRSTASASNVSAMHAWIADFLINYLRDSRLWIISRIAAERARMAQAIGKNDDNRAFCDGQFSDDWVCCYGGCPHFPKVRRAKTTRFLACK